MLAIVLHDPLNYVDLLEGITARELIPTEHFVRQCSTAVPLKSFQDEYRGETLFVLDVQRNSPVEDTICVLTHIYDELSRFVGMTPAFPAAAILIQISTSALPFAATLYPDHTIEDVGVVRRRVLKAITHQLNP
jgi:hypothetical protein